MTFLFAREDNKIWANFNVTIVFAEKLACGLLCDK